MKRYLLLIALLTLFPVVGLSEVAIALRPLAEAIANNEANPTEIVETELDPELKAYAKSITVRITSGNKNKGSGVIIGKQGSEYLVVTNNHVVRNAESLSIQTEDGVSHQGKLVENTIATDDDIALLVFESSNDYQPVRLNSVNTAKEEKAIYAVGYAAETGEFTIAAGNIERVNQKPFQEGYQIGYSSNVVEGMSGGAIFDNGGDLVGINGIGAFPILDTAYQYEDETTPSPTEIEQFRPLSWGLSLHRLLTQLNPEIVTAYDLPLPETKADLGKRELTGWLGELEIKAKQITVRIDSSSGANGSGVIIAKDGNTYTVLTADHVLCEKDEDTNDCLERDYEIVTPDGERYSLDVNTINSEPGVDLAVFEFVSNETYQVAELADYPLKDNDAVFIGGFPRLTANTDPQWYFSLGYGLNRERGLLSVSVASNSNNQGNSEYLSQSSLAGGYEMVYTSPTYGGMSGGAILDRVGRVIGIHGQAEGESLDNQSGKENQIQLGYSLGIPIDTLTRLKGWLGVEEILIVAENSPGELNSSEQETFEAAILGTEISQRNTTARGWLERGIQLWRLKRDSEALIAFDNALSKKKSNLNYLVYYGNALALINLKKYDSALENLNRGIKLNRNFVPNLKLQSSLLISLNQLDSALSVIDEIIIFNSNVPGGNYKNANLYANKGQILAKLQRHLEAESEYHKAIEITPNSSFYYDLHTIYAKQQKWNEAFNYYKKAVSFSDKSAKNYYIQGFLYSQQQKWDKALENYNKALTLDKSLAEAYVNIGNVYAYQRKWDKALRNYNEAITFDKSLAEAYANRGSIYAYYQRRDKALKDYNRAITLDKSLAEVFLNRSVINTYSGNEERALSDYAMGYAILSGNSYYKRAVLSSDELNGNSTILNFRFSIRVSKKNTHIPQVFISNFSKNYYSDNNFIYFNINESLDMNLLLPQHEKIVNSLFSLQRIFLLQSSGTSDYDYFFIDVDPQKQEWEKNLLN